LEHESTLLGGAQHVILGGFSQGAAMSVLTGLRYEQQLAGIICTSGYALFSEDISAHLGSHARDVPVWAYHGLDDSMVPFTVAQYTLQKLQDQGVQVTLTEQPDLEHSVDDRFMIMLAQFLQKTFA